MQRGGEICVGLLVSSSGPYATIGRTMLNGARLAIEEVNADPAFPFTLDAVTADPGGRNAEYAAAAQQFLGGERLVHVVGCYTSSSRKKVLPLFEKHDALLWYPSHYEGFESSENVVYTGAGPNQHIVPLAEHLLRRHGRTAYCIGSNYIWAWDNNKIMREAVQAAGGQVLAERYFAVGETDFSTVIEQILDARPAFVFTTLIGVSAYVFFRAFRAAALARGIDQPRAVPLASCSLAEPELVEIGPAACAGHLSASVYFESLDTPTNRVFVAAYRARFPDAGPTSADVESSYLAIHLLARAIRRAGTAEMAAVRSALPDIAVEAPQGRVLVDAGNRHCHLTPRIGVSTAEAGFEVIYEAPGPVRPDPYLVWHEFRTGPGADPRAAPSLRLLR